jgi:hypothetical protein
MESGSPKHDARSPKPQRVHLPTGRVVELNARGDLRPRRRAPGGLLFSELTDLVASGDVAVVEQSEAVDPGALQLRDYHALRAIAARLGWLAEEPMIIQCHNCGEPMRHAPCAHLELGPFLDGELHDPELDATLDLSVAHPVPEVTLPDGCATREVTLAPITAAEARPLHRALRRRRLVLTPRVVRAMGIAALGAERDTGRIAEALACCSDAAWEAIGDLFLQAHYPPRLSSSALCPRCGARNDVDAPYERELEPSRDSEPLGAPPPPDLETFAQRAHTMFEGHAGPRATEIQLFVEEGVPACDAGGTPLLGSYLPPGGNPEAPVGLAELAVYYRSFVAMWTEDGPYDWEAELDETIAHELEHHEGWRVGHDAMDEDEQREIAADHARDAGHKTVARAAARAFAADVAEFLARTWILWALIAAAILAVILGGGGGPPEGNPE